MSTLPEDHPAVQAQRRKDLRYSVNRLGNPTAPVVDRQPVNERAAFEKFYMDQAERFQPDLSRRGSHPESEYQRPSVQGHWEVWQARAALYAPPELAELQATIAQLTAEVARLRDLVHRYEGN